MLAIKKYGVVIQVFKSQLTLPSAFTKLSKLNNIAEEVRVLSVSGSLRGKSSLAVVSPTDPLLIAAGLLSSLHSSAGGRTGGLGGNGESRRKERKEGDMGKLGGE